MWAKRKGKVLVSCNDYTSFMMGGVLPIPDYKVVLPKGKFNGRCVHYSTRMDPDLGLG